MRDVDAKAGALDDLCDPEILQSDQDVADGRLREAPEPAGRRCVHPALNKHLIEDLQCVAGCTGGLEPLVRLVVEVAEAARTVDRVTRLFGDSGEEVVEPGDPITAGRHGVEMFVVLLARPLKVSAEVEQWGWKRVTRDEMERD